MKPNFALTLSFEGISLLHRAFPGWHMVGEVSLDSSDLAGALSDLRNRAGQLDSNPIRSKLVIPNDQIRFLQFDSEGLEADEIASAVHRALDGATPYAVDDLAYDWSISAGQVHIAAVARETLAEAEAFAAEHGFNPLCFVAAPEGRDFVGEPWFGETKSAPSLLPEGGRIERDTAAIRVIGTAPLHGAAVPAADTAPEAALEGATDAADAARPPRPRAGFAARSAARARARSSATTRAGGSARARHAARAGPRDRTGDPARSRACAGGSSNATARHPA